MMQKILVVVAAGVAMVNGAAHVAKCYDDAKCDVAAGTACGVICATEAGSDAAALTACGTEGIAIATACNVVLTPEEIAAAAKAVTDAAAAEKASEDGSGEAGAAGADATLPSVLAFTVGAAVAGMM